MLLILPIINLKLDWGLVRSSLKVMSCENGYEWNNGKWPYLEMECLNKKWVPAELLSCTSKLIFRLIYRAKSTSYLFYLSKSKNVGKLLQPYQGIGYNMAL